MAETSLSEVLLIINNVDNITELLDQVSPIDSLNLSNELADEILKYRNGLPTGKISSIEEIYDLVRADSEELLSFFKKLVSESKIHSSEYPFLLLPLRLETRFIEDDLWIRIDPDQIFLDTHIKSITKREYIIGEEYRNEVDALNGLEQEEKEKKARNSWRKFAAEFGSERAAYINHYIKKHGKPSIFHDDQDDFFEEINLQAMPSRFIAYAFCDGKLEKKKLGNLIPLDLDLIQGSTHEEDLFTSSTHWMINHLEAEKNGMAICLEGLIREDRSKVFDKIIVVGVRGTDADIEEQALRDLIDTHHYSSGLAFCELQTPTNNTGDLKSGYNGSVDDYEASYQTEIKGSKAFLNPHSLHKNNAQLLGKALGFDDDITVLRYLRNSGNKRLSYAREMNACIWPAAGKFFLNELMPGSEIRTNNIEEHFIQFVRALGHFPSLRVDTQPYGILPVTSVFPNSSNHLNGWKPSHKDTIAGKSWQSHDAVFHDILIKLFGVWRDLSGDQARVPRIPQSSDPDQSLISILAMEPISYKINARPILSEKLQNWLICLLRENLFGEGTVHGSIPGSVELWAGRWYQTANKRKDHVAKYISQVTGLDESKVRSSKLLNLFAWSQSGEIDVDFDFFSNLSLRLTYNKPEEREQIKRATNALKSISALEFLNSENDPKQIVKRIIDDPHFRKKGPHAYGVRQHIAEKILEFRNAKESKQLETTSELLEIKGLGPDTLHDIIYSFTNIDYPLLLKFFNNVSTPTEITSYIKDDPAYFGGGVKTRGISLSIARKIIEKREALDNGMFTDVSQIFSVEGIGDDTLHDILNSFVMATEKQGTDLLFRSSLDLFSHRLDAWITSLAFKRLESMREINKRGIYLGAYGWVENLRADDSPYDNEGYIHAPSRGQAAAAAVLYNAYLTHRENGSAPFKINLESNRVRKAMHIIEGMRQGQPLGALLGYLFEQAIQEEKLNKHKDEFRAAFPISQSETERPENGNGEKVSNASVSARNVVNGLSLLRWLENNDREDIYLGSEQEVDSVKEIIASGKMVAPIKTLQSSFDAVNDLLLNESVYHTVQGNYERAGAFMNATAGKNVIPEIESLRTPVPGSSIENKVCLFFPKPNIAELADFNSPRSKAAPRLTKWMKTLFDSIEDVSFYYNYKALKVDINQEVTEENKDHFMEDLKIIPGISDVLAEKIIEFKQGRIIKKFDELKAIEGIGDNLITELDKWIFLGGEINDQSFIQLVNLNTATEEDLEQLPGIGSVTAKKIIETREHEGSFKRVKDLLRIPEINRVDCDKLRRYCTTGSNVLSISDLGKDALGNDIAKELQLHPIDVFYLATIPPKGGETEIEQRLKYWIRREHNLFENDQVKILLENDHPFFEIVYLSQQIFKLLGKATPIRPNEFMLPDQDDQCTYTLEDVEALKRVANNIQEHLITLSKNLAESGDHQFLAQELLRASLYNIPIALPSGSNRENLARRANLVIEEIIKKTEAYQQQEDQINKQLQQEAPDFNKVSTALAEGIKTLIGKNFVIIPEFISNNPEGLHKMFNQNELLGDLNIDRIRLWINKAASTQKALDELKSTLLLTDRLLQTTPGESYYHYKVGQLPYWEGNRWLGLSDEERILFRIGIAEAQALNNGIIPDSISEKLSDLTDKANVINVSTGKWKILDGAAEYVLHARDNKIFVALKSLALNNTAFVAACCGEAIFTDYWKNSDKSICGLKIDAWLEALPGETANTSVAFHFDAPNTQAPQSLLLAVPPDRDKPCWEIDDLVQIISDTMELYKIRAVDFEAMRATDSTETPNPIGAFLPAAIVPVDASKRGWERIGDEDLISDWLSSLEE
jgi:DNA uptake protein ComE-like DNA-binding protein